MSGALARMKARMSRFGAANEAVAAVEFALILPFLLTLYFGSIEAASLLTVDRRIDTIAATMGDLVTQWNSTITTATMSDYFKASEGIISPYSKTGLVQKVTCVLVAADGKTAKVVWSRDSNGATPYAKDALFTLPPKTSDLAKGGYLIVSEASYSYLPVLGVVIKSTFNLSHQGYYAPRFGGIIDLT